MDNFSYTSLGTSSLFSPSSEFVASVSGTRLTVRNSDSLKVINVYHCVDKIEKIEFSPDSEFIMCGLFARNCIQVFSMVDKDWKCRIDEGIAGVINANWAPTSRNIITESDFGIQLSIWSLMDSFSVIISLPKPSYPGFTSALTAISDCGHFLAAVHRIELQDQIGIYSFVPLNEVSKFRTRSPDVAAIQWVPSGNHLVTIDSPLTYKFCVYTPAGELVHSYEAYQNALGLRLCAFYRPKNFLDTLLTEDETIVSAPEVESTTSEVEATAGTAMVALGSFDGKIRLLSLHSWQMLFMLPLVHPKEIQSVAGLNCSGVVTTVEILPESSAAVDPLADSTLMDISNGQNLRGVDVVGTGRSRLNISNVSTSKSFISGTTRSSGPSAATGSTSSDIDSFFVSKMIKALPKATEEAKPKTATQKVSHLGKTKGKPAAKSASNGGLPEMGVSWIGWSTTDRGSLLAARNETFPRCLWIWNPAQAKLVDLIVQLQPITSSQWRPVVKTTTTRLFEDSSHKTGESIFSQSMTERSSLNKSSASSAEIRPDSKESLNTPVLAYCTGNSRVYFWKPNSGATFVDVPSYEDKQRNLSIFEKEKLKSEGDAELPRLHVYSLRWSRDGKRILLRGRDSFCVCYYHDSMSRQAGDCGARLTVDYAGQNNTIESEFLENSNDASAAVNL